MVSYCTCVNAVNRSKTALISINAGLDIHLLYQCIIPLELVGYGEKSVIFRTFHLSLNIFPNKHLKNIWLHSKISQLYSQHFNIFNCFH